MKDQCGDAVATTQTRDVQNHRGSDADSMALRYRTCSTRRSFFTGRWGAGRQEMLKFYEYARRMLPQKRMAMTADWT